MSWFSRLRNAIRPQRLDEDLADEMRDHMECRADALRAAGCQPEEARRQAAIGFGNVTKLNEQSRDVRLWAALESMLQDVRYTWRGMRKNPAFAVTAVLSLGLAIGANTAIYSIVDAAMLRPLPVPEPDRLVALAWPTRCVQLSGVSAVPRGSGKLGTLGTFHLPATRGGARAEAGCAVRESHPAICVGRLVLDSESSTGIGAAVFKRG
jgi:hypothetical protein